MSNRKCRSVCVGVMVVGLVTATLIADDSAPAVGASMDVPVLTAYAWRGQILNDEAVMQPAVTVTKGGFAVNVWGNMNLTDVTTEDAPEMTEVDITPSWTMSAGPAAVSIGLVEYLFPHQSLIDETGAPAGAYPGTRELYASVGFAGVPGAPMLAVYQDIDEIDGTYAALSGSYGVKCMGEKVSLTLAASIGFGSEDYNEGYFGVAESALNDASATVSAGIAVGGGVTVTPAVQYVSLLDGTIRDAAGSIYQDDSQVVGSVKVTYTF